MKKEQGKTTGLYIAGTVQNRTKRMISSDQREKTEIVTYVITDDNDRNYYIDDFAPDHYYNINDFVEIPVYIKPYRKKTGDLSYSLSIQKPYKPKPKGESF